MKINNSRGDLANIAAETKPLVNSSEAIVAPKRLRSTWKLIIAYHLKKTFLGSKYPKKTFN